MMGLALGVDYSLFIVSRFREELAAGRSPSAAALRSRRTAGRTVVFAGSTLFISIFLSAFLQPGSLLVSLATALARRHRDQHRRSPGWRCRRSSRCSASGSTPGGSAAAIAPSARVPALPPQPGAALRRPALAAVLIAIPLVAARDPRRSPSTPVRRGSTSCRAPARPAAAPKRSTPPSAPAGRRPSSSSPPPRAARSPRRGRLALLARWQRRIAAQPDVKAVIGPAPIAARRARSAAWARASPPPPIGRKRPHWRRSRPIGGAACEAGATRARPAPRLRRGGAAAAAGSDALPPAAACSATGAGRARAGAGLLAGGLAAPPPAANAPPARCSDSLMAPSGSPRGSGKRRLGEPHPGARPALAAAQPARQRAAAGAAAAPANCRPPPRATLASSAGQPRRAILARVLAANRDEVQAPARRARSPSTAGSTALAAAASDSKTAPRASPPPRAL